MIALLQDSVGPEVCKETAPAVRGVGYWGVEARAVCEVGTRQAGSPARHHQLNAFVHIPLFKFH